MSGIYSAHQGYDKDCRLCNVVKEITMKDCSDKIPCFIHLKKGYKKGCKDCFEENKPDPRKDDLWHDQWESHEFGDK